MEHIDSATKNELKELDSQKNWILSAYQFLNEEQKKTYKESIVNDVKRIKSEIDELKIKKEEVSTKIDEIDSELNMERD